MPSQQVWSIGRAANQQEENGGHDLERECSSTSLVRLSGPSQHNYLYLSGQYCQTGWRHQGGYSERTEQSQERLQESERNLEITTVQHQTKAKAVPELRIVDPSLRINSGE